LKLGGLKDTFPERLALTRQTKMGHAAFVELLLGDEVTPLGVPIGDAARRAAGLDSAMRLDTWDEPDDLTYDRMLVSDLSTHQVRRGRPRRPDPWACRRREDTLCRSPDYADVGADAVTAQGDRASEVGIIRGG
jgi:hypothetical protein